MRTQERPSERIRKRPAAASLPWVEGNIGQRLAARTASRESQNEEGVGGEVPFRNRPVARPVRGSGRLVERVGLEIDGRPELPTRDQPTFKGAAWA